MRKKRLWFKKYYNIITGKGKPSLKLIHDIKGSVTIFLTVIMLPMLVFSFTVLDICKIFLAKDMIATATDSALHSAITSYDDVLKDMYGIFASSKSDEELTENIANYYSATLRSCGIDVGEDSSTLDFIQKIFDTQLVGEMNENNNMLKVFPGGEIGGVEQKEITLSAVKESAVTNPDVLRRQIVEYMKYRGPINMAAGLFEKINAFKDLPSQANALDKQLEYEKKLSTLGDNVITAYTLLQLYRYNNAVLEGNSGAPLILNNLFAIDERGFIIEPFKTPLTTPFKLADVKNDDRYSAGNSIRKYASQLDQVALYLTAVAPYIRGRDSLAPKYLSASSEVDTYDYAGKMKEAYDYFASPSAPDEANSRIVYETLINRETAKVFDDLLSFAGSNPQSGDYRRYIHCYIYLYIFAPLFYGTTYIEGDDFKDSKLLMQFISNYEWLVKNEVEVEERYTNFYNDIIDAENNIVYHIKEDNEFYTRAESLYNSASSSLNDLYDTMVKQNAIIDELLYYQDYYGIGFRTTLDGIFEQFSDAQDFAVKEYKPAIEAVENESQRNSDMAIYESEAQDFENLLQHPEQVASMISALKKQQQIYKDAIEAIESIILLPGSSWETPLINAEILGNEHRNAAKLDNLVSKINLPFNNSFSKIVDSIRSGHSYKGFSSDTASGYSSWTELFPEVTSNDTNLFYQKLAELSKPKLSEDTTKQGEDLKNTVAEKTSTDSSGVPEGDSDNVSGNIKPEGSAENPNALNPPSVKIDFDSSEGKTLATGNLSGSSDDSAMAAQTQSLLKNLMSYLSDLGEHLGDSILISQYFVEQFSCYTTNMDGKGNRGTSATMMSGYRFVDSKGTPNVAWYGAEQEYILYGKDTPEANISTASASIFAIRFVLNLIYSFTDSEINAFTSSVATAASALFPLAYPLIKAALHIGLALAESAYDLSVLKKGAEVPFYKTPSTWRCKGSNIVRNIVADVVEDVTSKAVDAIADELNDMIDNAANGINDFRTQKEAEFNKLLDDELAKLKSQVKNDVILPFQTAIQQCIINYGDAVNYDKLKDALDKALENTRRTLGLEGTPDSGNVLKTAEKQVLDYVAGQLSNYATAVSSHINDYIKAATGVSSADFDKDDLAENYLGEFSKKMDELFSGAVNEVGNAVKSVSGTVSNALNDALNALAVKAKSGINIGADAVKDTLSNVSNNIRGQGHLNTSITGKNAGGKPTSAGSVIGMSYQDYLTIFMIISVTAGGDKQLQRAAQLITVNVRKVTGNMGYDLNEAHVLFKAESTASVRTVFFGAMLEDGKIKMPDNKSKYSFKHISYLGY